MGAVLETGFGDAEADTAGATEDEDVLVVEFVGIFAAGCGLGDGSRLTHGG